MNFRLPRIYPITDVRLAGLSHTQQVTELIAGGARLVQLREKWASPHDFFESAKMAIGEARRSNVPVIVNDRVDMALMLGADGVHLGQEDMPPTEARSLLGDAAIIGFSTHSVEQAKRAALLPVDYIAIGPIFETRTKSNPDQAVGLDGLRAVRKAVPHLPIVAIGGIDAGNVASVIAAGADSAAIIAALLSDPKNIAGNTAHLIAIANDER